MDSKQIQKELRVIPIYDTVFFPHMNSKLRVNESFGKELSEMVAEGQHFFIALTVKEKNDQKLDNKSFFTVGNLVHIESIQNSDKGKILYIKSLKRIKYKSLNIYEKSIKTKYLFLPLKKDMDEANRVYLIEFIHKTIKEISQYFQGSESFFKHILKLETVEEIIAYTLPLMQISVAKKQEILEIESEKQLGIRFIDLLLEQKDSVKFQIEMTRKYHEKVNKSQREAILREQLKSIQQELGMNKPNKSGKKDYREQIEEAMMPEKIKEIAIEQVEKLESIGSDNQESSIIRNYLDLLIKLPWKPGVYIDLDIKKARKVLDEDHFGIEKVKKRITQYLSIMKLKKNKKGSILLFVGPPGTGKTSLGKSIAKAMGRKYQRLSLGGIRDEAEIRGHRRTYIGALPGRIIQGMKKAGEKNPVFVLDEVDKLMMGWSGDPASALLEVLDPEQNNTFTDHYLEVPYDLSEVFFIATANSTGNIPPPLLDRMEVIEMNGYTNIEKFHIGKKHILPAVLEESGLSENKLKFTDSALHMVINNYTREAGVRGLKKMLSAVARGASEKILTRKSEEPLKITRKLLKEILGKPKIRLEDVPKISVPGVVTGLAWTPMGGDILFIEASVMPGRGELILTGQLGDVMKESARISLSLIQSRLVHLIPQFKFTRNNIHIHVPAGAIPKDGPSAGITLFTALVSLLLNKPVDSTIAMSGEITLRGSVLPVGGIKEKVLAAHRAGIKKIILSRENKDDIIEIPEEVRKDLKFIFVETIEDLIKKTLQIKLSKPLYWGDNIPIKKDLQRMEENKQLTKNYEMLL